MKVVHLGNIPVPTDHPQYERVSAHQHPGRWVLNHALAQKAAGLDVEVVSQAHKASCDFDCDIEGVRVHFLRTFHPYRHFTFYALDSWRMARFVRTLHPDVVHAHGTEAAYGHAAVSSGFPFCVTAQGLFFQIIPTLGRAPTWNERFLRWGEDMVWKKTRFAIAKSEYGNESLRERYGHLDISLIHNAYDVVLERPVPPKAGRRVAFVGGVNERKGFHFLLKTAEKMAGDSGFAIHVVGNAPEGRGSTYENESIGALRSVLGERLVLHGKLCAEDVFSVLDICRVIAAPSLEEMSGNQVTEGIMRGCHAVVFDATGVSGIARKAGNSTIVPWGNGNRFADAVKMVLEHPPGPSEIEKSRESVSSFMSHSVVASLHERLYRRILSSWKSEVSGKRLTCAVPLAEPS